MVTCGHAVAEPRPQGGGPAARPCPRGRVECPWRTGRRWRWAPWKAGSAQWGRDKPLTVRWPRGAPHASSQWLFPSFVLASPGGNPPARVRVFCFGNEPGGH